MRYFRKRPIVINAFRLGHDDPPKWATDAINTGAINHRPGTGDGWIIRTLEGDMLAMRGDWIIKGVSGELYPCKHDIFEATYEEVAP